MNDTDLDTVAAVLEQMSEAIEKLENRNKLDLDPTIEAVEKLENRMDDAEVDICNLESDTLDQVDADRVYERITKLEAIVEELRKKVG